MILEGSHVAVWCLDVNLRLDHFYFALALGHFRSTHDVVCLQIFHDLLTSVDQVSS